MSAKLMAQALSADIANSKRKLVLCGLLDCAHEDGTRIFPSMATVGRFGNCDARTARRHVRTMVAVGLLRVVREGGRGPGSTTHYELDLELFRDLVQHGWEAVFGTVERALAAESEEAEPGAGHEASKGDTVSPLDEDAKADKSTPIRGTNLPDKGDSSVRQPLRTLKEPLARARAREERTRYSAIDQAPVRATDAAGASRTGFLDKSDPLWSVANELWRREKNPRGIPVATFPEHGNRRGWPVGAAFLARLADETSFVSEGA